MEKLNLLSDELVNDLSINTFDSIIIDDFIKVIYDDNSLFFELNERGIVIDNISVHRLPSSRVTDGVLLLASHDVAGKINGIFHISKLYDSDQVYRASLNAKMFSERLSEALISKHVFLPIHIGNIYGRSYSFSDYMYPLSSGKLWFFQKRYLASTVLEWLVSFASLPVSFCNREIVYKNLSFFDGKKGFIDSLSIFLSEAKNALECERWKPIHLPDHNDLWKGNFLVNSSKFSLDFKVIDWAAANVNGYGVHDLVTFSLSFGVSPDKLNRFLKIYQNKLGVSSDIILFQYLSSIGYLGRNMNNFPYVRYLEKVNKELSFLMKSLNIK